MSELQAVLDETELTLAKLARRIGRTRSYLCHVKAGRKPLGLPAAIAIWRETKCKIGPIANTSDSDIKALARFGEAP